jgi:hypothetical protein
VLIEQQTQLIESDASDLPVMLLVEISQCHRVSQQPVQILNVDRPRLLRQSYRDVNQMAVRLDLWGVLVNERFGRTEAVAAFCDVVHGVDPPHFSTVAAARSMNDATAAGRDSIAT